MFFLNFLFIFILFLMVGIFIDNQITLDRRPFSLMQLLRVYLLNYPNYSLSLIPSFTKQHETTYNRG